MGLDITIVAVVEYVVLVILCKYLAAMARAIEEIALLAHYHGRSVALGQLSTLSVAECSRQFATSADKEFVGVIVVPTRAYKHIPISVATVQITPLKNSCA